MKKALNGLTRFPLLFVAAAMLLSLFFVQVLPADDVKPGLSADKKVIKAKDAEGSYTAGLTITAPGDWTAELPKGIVTFKPTSGKAGRHGLNLHIFSNSELAERKTAIRIKCGEEVLEIPVEQEKVHDRLVTHTDQMNLCDLGLPRDLRITSSYDWKITSSDEWLKPAETKGLPGLTFLKIAADANETGEERTGTLTIAFTVIPAGGEKTVKVTVTQGKKGDYWNHGEVLWINKHKKGNGVPVFIVGDGFDREDLKKGGLWETVGRQLAATLIREMVFKDLYEDYIDIGVYMAESKERGVEASDYRNYIPRRDTAFGASQWGRYNGGKVRRELSQIPGVNKGAIRFCFMANGPFGGWAYLNDNAFMTLTQAGEGYWTAHEFLGHAFSGLRDIYNGDANESYDLVDKTNDPEKVKWAPLLKIEEYTKAGVGIHEYRSRQGCYLAEPQNYSTMQGGNTYFTVMERFHLWKYILRTAGEPAENLTLEQFIEFDKPRYAGKRDKYPQWYEGARPKEWWNDLWKVEVGD
ncbi:MAG: BACON domain-containing protein [Planctomycetaceae bacterium]|nr:BACON domain-containing protein [Planctomycetaceae bacterium]